MNQFIFDELTGTPTILATNRVKRIDQTGAVGNTEVVKTQDSVSSISPKTPAPCNFCKGNEGLTPPAVYQDADDWNVRVFPNKFPIAGEHEVIVHSPDHQTDIPDLSNEQNIKYVRALLNRVNYYTRQGKEVFIFNNRGGKAGASILHPHSQLIALEGFPGIIELEKHAALKYYNEHDSCYWCAFIKEETVMKNRLVYDTPHFTVLVPRASRWSYETIMIPKVHRPNFEYIDEVEISDLAKLLKAILFAYDDLFDHPDRNFWMHTQRYDPFHWHIGFIPHTKVLGGLELGAGIWVSDRATPEYAAQELGVRVKTSYEQK
jgi:UDPglucose--hexose-1-phosphate uridylyltransferase